MVPSLLGEGSYKDVLGSHCRLHICRIYWHPGVFACVLDNLLFSSHLPPPQTPQTPPHPGRPPLGWDRFFCRLGWSVHGSNNETELVIDGIELLPRDVPVPTIFTRRLRRRLSITESRPRSFAQVMESALSGSCYPCDSSPTWQFVCG